MLAAAVTALGLSPSLVASAALASNFPFTGGAPIAAATASAPSSTATVRSGLSGVGLGKPSLSFDIRAKGSFPITAVTVALPPGLAFSRHAADLKHAVGVTGSAKSQSTVHKGVLVVALHGTTAHLELKAKGPALTESKSLLAAIVKLVQYDSTHPTNRHSLTLKLTVTVESGAIRSIKVPVTFTLH